MLRQFHHLPLRNPPDQIQMQPALALLGLRVRRGPREGISNQGDGGQAATAVGQRAQGGARKVYQYITDKPEKSDKDKRAPEHTGSIGGLDAIEDTARDTLTPDDMQIDWQGAPPPP